MSIQSIRENCTMFVESTKVNRRREEQCLPRYRVRLGSETKSHHNARPIHFTAHIPPLHSLLLDETPNISNSRKSQQKTGQIFVNFPHPYVSNQPARRPVRRPALDYFAPPEHYGKLLVHRLTLKTQGTQRITTHRVPFTSENYCV